MIASTPAAVRVYHNITARCARCSANCSATVYEIGGQTYGSRCAEIVLGAEVFAAVSGKGGGSKGEGKEEGADPMPALPVRPRTMIAKFGGKCSCGARFAAGSEIVYRDGGVAGCASCDFGAAAPAGDWLTAYADMTSAQKQIDDHVYRRARLSTGAYNALRARHAAAMALWCRLTPAQAEQAKAYAA